MKVTTTVMLGVASLALAFSACGGAANTTTTNSSTTNSSTSNSASQSNSARAANSNQTAASNTATSNTATASNTSKAPADKAEGGQVDGELQVGKSESVILYVGKESGDYAGYCFTNDSEAGRAILAACKDRAQCEVVGKIDYESNCKVPGLEADLSSHGRILKVASAKLLGGKK